MRKAVGILVLGLGFLLAACGTSGSSSGSNDVTVTITATGASFAAYRAGSGSWQAPADPTSFSFTVTGGGAYDVAVRCGDNVKVFSFTTDDLTSFDASCGATPTIISFDVSYDASSVTGAASVELYYKGSLMPLIGNVTDTISVTGEAGLQDLVLVVYDVNLNPLAARIFTVTAAGGDAFNFTVSDADAAAIATGTFPDFSAEVPAGYTPGWDVTAVTPNGTLVFAGFGSAAGGGPFLDFSFADRNVFAAGGENPPYTVGGFFVRASGTPTIALPNAIDPSASGSPVSVTNLTVSANLLVYSINVSWGTSPVEVNVTISKAYLGSGTGYTLPDLTALSGFGDTLPASGDTVYVSVTAVESNRTLAEVANMGDADVYFLPDGTDAKFATKDISYGL